MGSGRRERFEASFFLQVGHSLLPERSAVTMHSAQNLKRKTNFLLDRTYLTRLFSAFIDIVSRILKIFKTGF